MAEEAQFLKRSGSVINVQDLRLIGKGTKYEKQVGGFTIETSREYKDKTYHDYLTFDCEGKVMSSYPSVGDNVTVDFTITGSKWVKEGKTMYFNKLRAFKIETKFSDGKRPAQTSNVDDLDDFLGGGNSQASQDLPF